MIPPTDETFQPGESMIQISSKEELKPGDVIRIWNGYLGEWTPGWWCEVLKIDINNKKVYLKDLKSGKEIERVYGPTTDRAADLTTWKHPNPERVKALGEKKGKEERERLNELRKEYESLDFSKSSEAEMIARLKDEMAWRNLHDRQFYNMKEEFGIREIAIKKIGEELNKRGGIELMRDVFRRANGNRSLEMIWGGIGEWMA